MDQLSLRVALKNLVRDERSYPAMQQVAEGLKKSWAELNLLDETSDKTFLNVARLEGRKEALRWFFEKIEGYAQSDMPRKSNIVKSNPDFDD